MASFPRPSAVRGEREEGRQAPRQEDDGGQEAGEHEAEEEGRQESQEKGRGGREGSQGQEIKLGV